MQVIYDDREGRNVDFRRPALKPCPPPSLPEPSELVTVSCSHERWYHWMWPFTKGPRCSCKPMNKKGKAEALKKMTFLDIVQQEYIDGKIESWELDERVGNLMESGWADAMPWAAWDRGPIGGIPSPPPYTPGSENIAQPQWRRKDWTHQAMRLMDEPYPVEYVGGGDFLD